MRRFRLILAALLVAAAAIVLSPAGAQAMQDHAPAARADQGAPSGQAEHVAGEEAHEGGWMATIAKAVNFALLVGILVYFLRVPLMGYLNGRIGKVREDLVSAAQTREQATRALVEIDTKLKALPGELDTLRRRGAEDIAAERLRIEEAAEAERQRLLEHTRREIDMRMRVARRELLELTANLAVGVAAERIKRTITPEDQARMVDRYAAQLAQGSREVRR